MGKSTIKENKVEERNCVTPGSINICKNINGDTRDRKWDFLRGCWKENKVESKIGWDLRYTN